MLEVRGLSAGYGPARILFELSIDARHGEVVALLGRNGAGKSTTLRTIMGLVRPSAGEVRLEGRRIDGLQPFQIARLGLGYVPEDRRIFADLTVMENLEVARHPTRSGTSRWSVGRIFDLFPQLGQLRARLGGQMSGGEQQMLAIGRALMADPRAILLDEPSEGLAPLVVRQMTQTVLGLKSEGLTVLLCEQNLAFAQRVADRAFVLEQGQLRYSGTMRELASDAALRDQYLSVG